jgi:hypothetical protein
MLVDIHAKYLAVSGEAGHHEFQTDKGNPGHSPISLLTMIGVL